MNFIANLLLSATVKDLKIGQVMKIIAWHVFTGHNTCMQQLKHFGSFTAGTSKSLWKFFQMYQKFNIHTLQTSKHSNTAIYLAIVLTQYKVFTKINHTSNNFDKNVIRQ